MQVTVLKEDEKEISDIAEVSKSEEAPVIALVNLIILRAVKEKASDIHIELFGEESLRVRYRIDGILIDVMTLPKNLHLAVISRIKIMSDLDIAERRLPQDGRIQVKVGGRNINIRVSTIPTIYGEKTELRILDKSKGLIEIEHLGFSTPQLNQFKNMINKSYGIILITGPTGSGKTTTLYAALNRMDYKQKNIITIEDPVEYKLNRINQIQILPKINLNFANALRSILRQDPDIVMVGEIRDEETAETAIQAALTGHLVFSTLHTNDAAGAIPRLIEMGANPASITPALNLVVSQRLVRRVCKKCAKKIILNEKIKKILRKELENLPSEIKPNLDNIEVFQAQGCLDCNNTGYRGRIGIYEMLKKTPRIEETIITVPSIPIMKKVAIEEGMITIKQDGILRILEGITTIEELERVLGPLEE